MARLPTCACPRPARRAFFAAIVVVLAALGARPAAADGFYDPPVPLPKGPPGTLLRTEPLPFPPAGSRAWRVLYRSTRPDGSAIAVSGVVYAPVGDAPPAGRPVVAWAHPTTGIADSCAPSLIPVLLPSRIAGLEEFLARGYVVAATDYAGLGAPGVHGYLVGESEGRAVLDSVRAAGQIPEAGAGRTVALWGHSQGGHAALFAGQLAAGYAPELTVVGIAAAAPPTDLALLLALSTETAIGRLLASFAFVSWSAFYPDADYRRLVQPWAGPLMESVGGTCVRTSLGALVALLPAWWLGPGFLAVEPQAIEPWRTLFALNSPGAAPLPAPLLITQGLADEIVYPFVTEAYVAGRCRAGEIVLYRPYPEIDHPFSGQASAPEVVAWIADRFAGRPAPNGCAAPD